ncbi:MAG: mechanosensitive ion channel family protein [Streptococcaceae bacterium]|jgi:small conductance mechanosensitive channel|nr:mechanosensitive ion channel family protein [Streptococcaceae bacterium]
MYKVILLTNSTNEFTKEVTKNVGFMQKYLSSINWDKFFATMLTKGISIILSCFLFFILFKIGQKIIAKTYKSYLKRNFTSTVRAKTIKHLLDSAFYYAICFITGYTFLAIIGIPIGSLLAGAGIIGLAIGLGAQGFMNDLITGFFIIIEQQIDVGEKVRMPNLGIEGSVISVGIRTVKIKSPEGYIHFIPNRNITTITNLSRLDIKVIVDISIVPEEGIERITEIIEKITKHLAKEYKGMIKQGPKILGLVDLGGGNFAIRTIMFVVNKEQSNIKQVFTAEYVQALTKENFTIPSTNLVNI